MTTVLAQTWGTVRGRSIYLRPLREEDFTERYIAWFRDAEVTRFLDARGITRQDAIDHLRQGRNGAQWRLYAICEAVGDRHIGNLKIGPIQWRHMVSDMVTVIGECDAWCKGFAREAIRLGIEIAFGEMNLRKLSASIDSLNVGSLKCYQAAGFEIETSLKRHFMDLSDGTPRYSDKVYVACFNPRFDAGRAPPV